MLLVGFGGLSFGIYAVLRGGRGQEGGLGPIPERLIHAAAGIRMILLGLASLAAGLYLVLS